MIKLPEDVNIVQTASASLARCHLPY